MESGSKETKEISTETAYKKVSFKCDEIESVRFRFNKDYNKTFIPAPTWIIEHNGIEYVVDKVISLIGFETKKVKISDKNGCKTGEKFVAESFGKLSIFKHPDDTLEAIIYH